MQLTCQILENGPGGVLQAAETLNLWIALTKGAVLNDHNSSSWIPQLIGESFTFLTFT